MKKESKEEKFIAELLTQNSDLRDATLWRGMMLSRGKRLRRRITRGGFFVIAVGAATVLMLQHHRRVPGDFKIENSTSKIAAPAVALANTNSPIRLLTDAELLDLFKGKPV